MQIDPIIINSVVFLGAIGLLFGIGLGFAAKKFAVQLDPREEEILKLLAGANCGACGYPGCAGYAAALVKGEAEPGKCPAIPPETNARVAGILGRKADVTERQVAVIRCGGGENCANKMVYGGIKDCRIAAASFGGPKKCAHGCLGYGSCAAACPFGAVSLSGEGAVPVIDTAACTGCGLCVPVCPKGLITLVPCRSPYFVACRSEEKGADVKGSCSSGCTGCGICAKLCPKKGIVIENNVARILLERCDRCGICFEKCPTKAIRRQGVSAPGDLKNKK